MPGIGDHVLVTFLDTDRRGGLNTVDGALNVETDDDGISALVIESDGGATRIPTHLVVKVEAES